MESLFSQFAGDAQPLGTVVVIQQFYRCTNRPMKQHLQRLRDMMIRYRREYPEGPSSMPLTVQVRLASACTAALEEVWLNADHLETHALRGLMWEPNTKNKGAWAKPLCVAHLFDVAAAELLRGNAVDATFAGIQALFFREGDELTRGSISKALDELDLPQAAVDAIADRAPGILCDYYRRTQIEAN